ncbi:MAG: dethiobiotin synthase [Acidimicrobiia bacterium]
MIQFVTGTDTGVGKTVVSAALASRHRSLDLRVAYLKPVQTGVAEGEPGDAAFVAAATGLRSTEGMRFTEALAPAVAAERAGKEIDLEVLAHLAEAEEELADMVVVEGAGGLLAPLSGELTMADLALRLDAEVVVVARPGLGTLNHTALTLEAAAARRLRVLGTVVSGWPDEPGPLERTNLVRLARLGPLIGLVPLVSGLDTARPLETGSAGVGAGSSAPRLIPGPSWALRPDGPPR